MNSINQTPVVRMLLGLAAMLGCASPLPAQTPPALVRVDAVRIVPVEQSLPVIGRLVAMQAGSISSRIDGPVERVRVKVGDRVDKGQVVAELDTSALAVRLTMADALLGEARALLVTRKAQLDLARQEVTRLKRVKNSAVTTRAAVDDAVQQVVIDEAKVSEAEAAVDSVLASLQLAQLHLEHAAVRAPYKGVIVKRSTESGAYVKTGETVAQIIDDESLEVEADIPFERLAGVTAGTAVQMFLDDGGEHSATVRAVIPQEDDLTRTRAVRFTANFKGGHGPLAVHQSVTLYIPVGAPRKVLSVHKDGIIKRGGKDLVYVVVEGVAKIRPVMLGAAVGSRFEVLGGLSEGEQVVVRGNERLQPDAPVQINEGAS